MQNLLAAHRLPAIVAALMASFVIGVAQANNEDDARNIAIDVSLASWAGGACSAVMTVDKDAILHWSRVIIDDLGSDTAAVNAIVKEAVEITPKVAGDTLKQAGWAQFCASIMLGYGDHGTRRQGLVHKSANHE